MSSRALLLIPILLCACASPRPSITDDDSASKIRAMKSGVEKHDRSIIEPLINNLDSDDPAVRLYAIQALERLTNQTMDYQYYDDSIHRQPAIQRWRDWLTRQP